MESVGLRRCHSAFAPSAPSTAPRGTHARYFYRYIAVDFGLSMRGACHHGDRKTDEVVASARPFVVQRLQSLTLLLSRAALRQPHHLLPSMTATHAILLRGGTILLHDEHDRVEAVEKDILVVGSKIAKIDRDILAPEAEVIDCSDKIVSPGFIDTHHHVWQSQFRGVHADQSLVQFAASGTSGNFAGRVFTPDDVFWGQLAGCMEMIDVGTTTVVDYTHVNPAMEYGEFK